MSAALFDSNIVIDFAAGLPAALRETQRYDHLLVSVVTWVEVMAGTKRDDEAAIRRVLAGFDVVQLTPAVAEQAATIRRERRIKLPDAIIQATAQVSELLLVTRNTKDFPESLGGIRNPYAI